MSHKKNALVTLVSLAFWNCNVLNDIQDYIICNKNTLNTYLH